MDTAFPLLLHVMVNDYPGADIADPILTDELKEWFSRSEITDYCLQWRAVDNTHPYFNKLPAPMKTDRDGKYTTVVDTWIVFKNKRDATLFKLTWGRYEGS